MRWRISPLAAIGLATIAGVNVWLLTALAMEVASDGLSAADKVDWSFNPSTSVGSVASRRPIETYGQILARPIFFKSREPFVPAPPQAAKAPPAPPTVIDPGLVLGGVMIKDDVRKAFVFSRANADGAWISERDTFMGWELRSISATGARLEQLGRSIELQLYPQQ